MPIIFSVVQSVLVPYLDLLGSLPSMSGRLVRTCRLVSVLLSTSKSVRKAMKLWDISGDGGFWKVQLDVRDLGGHLDFTFRARAGTLSNRVRKATAGVASVGALPLGFQVKLGLVRGIYLLASMLQRLLMSPPRQLVLLGLLLFVQFGPLRCLLLILLPFLTFLMGLLGLILLFTLFDPGFV